MNNIKEITIKEPWFTLIKNKLKTKEGRLNKGMFSDLKVGSKITWMTRARNNNKRFKKVLTEVIEIKKFNFFKEMLREEGIQNVLPGFPSTKCGVELYHKYYKPYMEKKFGVVSITIKVIS